MSLQFAQTIQALLQNAGIDSETYGVTPKAADIRNSRGLTNKFEIWFSEDADLSKLK